MTYRRGKVWWFKFQYRGIVVRESAETSNREAARQKERDRITALKNAGAALTKPKRVPMFSVAAAQYLEGKRGEWKTNTHTIEALNVAHLETQFQHSLLSDIDDSALVRYRDHRVADGAALKTVGLEIATLRAIMLRNDLDAVWAKIRKTVKVAKMKPRKVARVITSDEETALLRECGNSRSRSLFPAVMLAIEAGMRLNEIRTLRWRHIDLGRRTVTIGTSKTEAGEGRVIHISTRLYETLSFWASRFPGRKLDHFVFPSEHVGQPKENSFQTIYKVDPTQPIGSWKEGWEAAKVRAGVPVRFHDLRHLFCTRLLESGASFPVVAEIMGWATSTAILLAKETYGHIGAATKKAAIEERERLEPKTTESVSGWAQKRAQFDPAQKSSIQ